MVDMVEMDVRGMIMIMTRKVCHMLEPVICRKCPKINVILSTISTIQMSYLHFALKLYIDGTNTPGLCDDISPYSVYMVLAGNEWTFYGIGNTTQYTPVKTNTRFIIKKAMKREYMIRHEVSKNTVSTTTTTSNTIPPRGLAHTEQMLNRTRSRGSNFTAKLEEFYHVLDGKCIDHIWNTKEMSSQFTKSLTNEKQSSTSTDITAYTRPLQGSLATLLYGSTQTIDEHDDMMQRLVVPENEGDDDLDDTSFLSGLNGLFPEDEPLRQEDASQTGDISPQESSADPAEHYPSEITSFAEAGRALKEIEALTLRKNAIERNIVTLDAVVHTMQTSADTEER
jgi:hypothetical protein